MVEFARLALTSTPSIGPSCIDVTRPAIAAEGWARPSEQAVPTPTAIATNTATPRIIEPSRARDGANPARRLPDGTRSRFDALYGPPRPVLRRSASSAVVRGGRAHRPS